MPWLAIGTAVGGGLLNMAAGNAEREQQNKAKQRTLSLLQENIIDPEELDLMLRNVNRLFNNRLVNTLNSTALQSRGFANANVAKATVAGAMEGSRLQSVNDTQQQAAEANRATRAQMAQVEGMMIPQGSALGDFAGGAIQGAQAGMQLSGLLSAQSIAPTHAPSAGALTETMKGPEGLWDNKRYDDMNLSAIPSNSGKGYGWDNTIRGFDSPKRGKK